MTKYLALLCLVTIIALSSFSLYHQDNDIPVVEIIDPSNRSTVSYGSVINYRINISDKEDGTSKYDEIQQTEVFLQLKYLPSEKDVSNYLQKEKQSEKAFILMKQNGCLNCHSLQYKLAGPSFRDIATRYGAATTTYEKLSEKIIKGSHGVWGDSQQMPPHPDLIKEDAVALARLVVQYGTDKNIDLYTGTEGTIQLRKNQNKNAAVLLLTASYLDHGIESANRKEGRAVAKIYLK